MRAVFLIGICAILGGCAISPSNAISFAVGSASYFFTGKTTTDHALSLVMQEDCELVRVIDGEICADEQDYKNATMVAALQPLPDGANFGDTRVEVVELPSRAMMESRRDEALETSHPAMVAFKVSAPPRTDAPATREQIADQGAAVGRGWTGQTPSTDGRAAIMQ